LTIEPAFSTFKTYGKGGLFFLYPIQLPISEKNRERIQVGKFYKAEYLRVGAYKKPAEAGFIQVQESFFLIGDFIFIVILLFIFGIPS